MITLRDALMIEGLGLTRAGQVWTPDARVRWAHVSELLDPSPWLLGEEFLLTTAVNIPDDIDATREYCIRLVNAGVSALGVSSGSGLPHAQIPPGLLAAADATGLVLIHVPARTLLQSVVQRIADSIHRESSAPLERSLAVQRELSEAAAGTNGLERMIDTLHRSADFSAVVYDDRLHVIASTDMAAEQRLAPIKADLRPRLLRGMRWSMSSADSVHAVIALPLGTEGRLRGILVASKPGTASASDRATLGTAVSLMSIFLEWRHAQRATERALRRQALDALLASPLPSDAPALLRAAGIVADEFQVLVADAPTAETPVTGLEAALSEFAGDVLVRSDASGLTIVICDPSDEFSAAVPRIVSDAGVAPAGLGEVQTLSTLRAGLAQARFAQEVARHRGMGLLRSADVPSYRALLTLGGPETRRSYADLVLGPIDDDERGGSRHLVPALRAYIDAVGNLAMAAENLGIHRHTLRSRLNRIGELTGRDVSRSGDLFELWLALEFRAIASSGAASDQQTTTTDR